MDRLVMLTDAHFMGNTTFFTMGYMMSKLHDCAAVKDNEELANKLVLCPQDVSVAEAAQHSMLRLKDIVMTFTEEERKRFVILVHGANINLNFVRVDYIDKVMLPTW